MGEKRAGTRRWPLGVALVATGLAMTSMDGSARRNLGENTESSPIASTHISSGASGDAGGDPGAEGDAARSTDQRGIRVAATDSDADGAHRGTPSGDRPVAHRHRDDSHAHDGHSHAAPSLQPSHEESPSDQVSLPTTGVFGNIQMHALPTGLQQQILELTRRDTEGLIERQSRGGGAAVDLESRFHNVPVAVLNDQGQLVIDEF